jgi:outer membrane immunogenic protein
LAAAAPPPARLANFRLDLAIATMRKQTDSANVNKWLTGFNGIILGQLWHFRNDSNHPQVYGVRLVDAFNSSNTTEEVSTMKRLGLIVCGGVMAAAMATGALAADLPRKAAPYYSAPGFSWTGFYLGVNGGYAWGDTSWSSTGVDTNYKVKGGLFGGTVGYNLQTGLWVWGAEGDFDFAQMTGSSNTGLGVCSGTGCETRINWLATGRGRIGYANWDRWLPYITGGAAMGAIKMTPNTGLNETKSRLGWTVGAGVEYAMLSNWSLKAEYLYVDLGKASCSVATCGVDTTVKYNTSIVRAGVNYRF